MAIPTWALAACSRASERSLSILSEIDQVEAEVSVRNRSPRGHLRVGAPLEIGRRRIAPLVGAFCRQYPDVTVELC